MKVPLSVVVITLNEEKNIKRCIDSVKEIADDIVVVDSYSTDKTEEICNREGIRFIKHRFEGHIQQKNFAVTQAKYTYVLSLDADEALSSKLKDEINKVKDNWNADGYSMNRLTNYCGKWIRHSGWYPDEKLRLWDRERGKWGGVNPHDKYEMDKTAVIKHLDGDILHYSYYTVDQHILQIEKFAAISAREKFEKRKTISLPFSFLRVIAVFLKKYFIKLGFLDGYYGFVICRLSAYGVFLKDRKLRELNKNNR